MARSAPDRPHYYVLIDRRPVPLADNDVLAWAAAFENIDNRHVANTKVHGVCVSTVFIGIDMNWFGTGPPILFETMVFGGALDGRQLRCSTWEEAEIQHEFVVSAVKLQFAAESKTAEDIEILERMMKDKR
jgi:hypothetical protein